MISFLFFLAVACSQFYFYKSGVPQPAHFIFVIIFIYFIFFNLGYYKEIFRDRYFLRFLYFFLVYIFVVNLLGALVNSDIYFLASVVYFLYGLLIVFLVFSYLILGKNKGIIIMRSLFLGSLILFFLCIFEIGRFDFYPRFNAFFNDPNQMAFWSLCVAASFMLLASFYKTNILYSTVVFFTTVFIIVVSASRSAILGLLPMIIGFVLIYRFKYNSGVYRFMAFIALLFLFAFFWYRLGSLDQTQSLIGRFLEIDAGQQLEGRGYSRFQKFPEYLLFGAGQGADYRFDASHEVHSTWAGILFYYGFVGLSLFLVFIGRIFSNLNFPERIIFISPLIYGFSTFGVRTPIFWFFISISIYVAFSRKRNIVFGA